jgi:putative Holliday junction resolvase
MSQSQLGEVSPQAAKIHDFAAELGAMANLPIYFVDERLTTREAHEILYAAGKSRGEHKPLVDQVAATIILRTFLDAQPRPAAPDTQK